SDAAESRGVPAGGTGVPEGVVGGGSVSGGVEAGGLSLRHLRSLWYITCVDLVTNAQQGKGYLAVRNS
ncbi:unnamed protein product, partial [Closterium sp. NIES-53]